MRSRRLVVHDPEGTPLWVQLHVQPVGARWAARLVPEGADAPAPGELKGAVLFAESAEEAEARALAFLGKHGPQT
jgi:hypothetical protein